MAVQTQLNGLDLEALGAIVGEWQANADKRKTVWRSRVEWDGGFRNRVYAREHAAIRVDEPAGLAGSDTAPNPAELLLGAVGTCLSIGYALNAAARGIELRNVALELEGDIDLTVFAGMAEEGMPGYSDIRVRAHITSDAPEDVIQALHEHVVRTSPICSTVARPVNVTTEVIVST